MIPTICHSGKDTTIKKLKYQGLSEVEREGGWEK